MGIWDWLVQIHAGGEVGALVLFWGTVLALILLAVLQVSLLQERGQGAKAFQIAREAPEQLKRLSRRMDELEQRMKRRLEARFSEMQNRATIRINRRGDVLQQGLEEQSASLSDSIGQLEPRVAGAAEEIERFRSRLRDVEDRTSNLLERLARFRGTLASTFNAELDGVLGLFDNSISGILRQIRSELQLGVRRMENVEGLVQSRHRRDRSLLGPARGPGPAGEGSEFEGIGESEDLGEWALQLLKRLGIRKEESPEEGRPKDGQAGADRDEEF